MKKVWIPLLLLVLLTGCAPKKQVFQVVYLDVFDTVTTIRGYDTSQQAFNEKANAVHRELQEYHRLFDIYHECPGGVSEINRQAGVAAVPVDERVMALLLDCREYYQLTGGNVNAAMGSVLRLWHEARELGMENPELAAVPDWDALTAAAEHIDFDNVILDADAGTIFLCDPLQQLDVGAIAKGWTAQQVSQLLPEGFLLNLGGNICARGSKPDGSSWVIGIQDPDNAAQNLCTVGLADTCAVTSGDYQRYFIADGQVYHHIIDPETLFPAGYWRSVTVLCPDSGLADCLSTALFLLPLEEGTALAEQCSAQVMWVNAAGEVFRTEGFGK